MIEKLKPSNDFVAGDNEYSRLDNSDKSIRSGRNLESYKRVFGEDFGMNDELILDVGAGDATMADEIEVLTDHKAKVIRFDRDYNETAPIGEAPAVVGDATMMPFEDNSINRVVSHNMMYYLGREKGSQAISEMLRVLKPGGEIAIYPSRPFSRHSQELSHSKTNGLLNFPTLIISKPIDFDTWADDHKQKAYKELAEAVSAGKNITKMIHWGVNKTIERKGTHRTVEKGSSSSL